MTPEQTTQHPARFDSLPQLRAEHARLLEAQRRSENAPEFLNEIADFIERGAATGVYIDEEDDRRGIQSLLDYWANVLYRHRYESPDPTLAEFDEELAPDLKDKPCPYQGLEAFLEDKKDFFYGREVFVDELMARLEHDRLLALVGSSGSGKSSVVFAGLLPRLKAGIGANWRYLTMVPSAEPLGNLARVMPSSVQGDAPRDLTLNAKIVFAEDNFRRNSGYLAQLADETGDQPVVLVVDQFEEAFTLCTDGQARKAFVDQLIGLVQSPYARHIVILTMRTDFVDNVAKLPELQPLFQKARVDVSALSYNELRTAIVKPAEQVGLKFEEGIVDDLVQTIVGEQAGLPLLQFTLLKLWEGRDRNRITKEVYAKVGNPRQALERSAEAFYKNLIPQSQNAARQILLTMVQPGDGREVTSNRIRLADVFNLGLPKDRVEEVLKRLIFEARLVKLTGVPLPDPSMSLADLAQGKSNANGAVPQIEVAHEALVRNWPRLVTWLDDERVRLRERRPWVERAQRWRENSDDPSLLLRGRDLVDAERFVDNELVRQLVDASRDQLEQEERDKEETRQRELQQARALAEEQRKLAEEQRLRAEQEQQLAQEQRKLAEEQHKRAEEQTQAARRLRALVAALVVAVLVAIAFAAVAFAAQQKAEANAQFANAQRDIAKSRQLAADAKGKLNINPVDSLSITLQALAVTRTLEAEDALREALEAPLPRLVLRGHRVFGAQFSPDSMRIVTANDDNMARIWDAETGELLARLIIPRQDVTVTVLSAQFSPDPDGKQIVTVNDDGTARVWDAGTRQERLEINVGNHLVTSAAFSPDGRRLVTGSDDGTLRLWEIDHSRFVTAVVTPTWVITAHGAYISSVSFSPDDNGNRIVSASADRTVRDWDTATGSALGTLTDHEGVVNSAQFSPDGQRIVTASEDETARIWDLVSRTSVALRGHDGPVKGAAFSRDGRWIVTASDDLTARVWNAETKQEWAVLRGHTGTVTSARFSKNGQRILTASADNTTQVWDLVSDIEQTHLSGHTEAVNSAQFSEDGLRIVTAGSDGTVRVWDATGSGILAPTHVLTESAEKVNEAEFSRDGKQLLTAVVNGTIHLWTAGDDGSWQVARVITGHVDAEGSPRPINSARFSKDGQRIVTAGYDNAARVWDLATNGPGVVLTHTDRVVSADFSPDGERIVTAGADNVARVWDAESGRPLYSLEHARSVNEARFSPKDGKRIVTAGDDNLVIVWDAETGKRLVELKGHTDAVNDAQFLSDGKTIVTASSDRTVRLWDAESGAPLGILRRHRAKINSAQLSPDGKYVLIASDDGTAQVDVIRVEDLIERVKSRLERINTK